MKPLNRRSFLTTMLHTGAAFTILPGAGRVWKATRRLPPFPHPMTGWVLLADFSTSRYTIDPVTGLFVPGGVGSDPIPVNNHWVPVEGQP